MKTVQDVIENNARVLADRDGRPGLDYRMRSYVVAKDSKNGWVLLGGLGSLGVGQMWFCDEDSMKQKPGYAEAPEQEKF